MVKQVQKVVGNIFQSLERSRQSILKYIDWFFICNLTAFPTRFAVRTFGWKDETRQVSNEVMSKVSSFTFGGVHSIRSQSIAGPVSYFIFLNVDYPSNSGQFAKANYESSRLPNSFRSAGRSTGGDAGGINGTLENQSLLANIGYSIIFLGVCILLISNKIMILL